MFSVCGRVVNPLHKKFILFSGGFMTVSEIKFLNIHILCTGYPSPALAPTNSSPALIGSSSSSSEYKTGGVSTSTAVAAAVVGISPIVCLLLLLLLLAPIPSLLHAQN